MSICYFGNSEQRFKVYGELKEPSEFCHTFPSKFPMSMYIDCKYYGIWDNKKNIPLLCRFDELFFAHEFCNFLNELNAVHEKNKPKPLKDEILEALGDISVSKYEMRNKILKQKEHIKTLETKIKLLKRDNKGLQRSYCKLSEDYYQKKGEVEYWEHEAKIRMHIPPKDKSSRR